MTIDPLKLTDAEVAAFRRDDLIASAAKRANEKLGTNSPSFLCSLPGFIPVAPVEYWACIAGDTATAKLKQSIEDGANVNQSNELGYTPLHAAIENGRLENAKILLLSGAFANAKTSDGLTALDLARANGNAELVSLLESAVS
jgi:hypothetical protein